MQFLIFKDFSEVQKFEICEKKLPKRFLKLAISMTRGTRLGKWEYPLQNTDQTLQVKCHFVSIYYAEDGTSKVELPVCLLGIFNIRLIFCLVN